MTKIGIIREYKVPPDARVPLSPEQCREAMNRFENLEIVVQPSPIRSFRDEEFVAAGIKMQDDLSDCDVLLGVKEVPVEKLIAEKTYLFFTHTIKKQPYNRHLLQALLEKKIRAVDYEVITDEKNQRLIAFGFYAGVVGAHNSLWVWGKRTGDFALPRMIESRDYAEVKNFYKKTMLPPLRIVLTGGGRVASGAVRTLLDMGIRQVLPADFLKKTYPHAVFTQLHAIDYVERLDGEPFDKSHFYRHPEAYRSKFLPYTERSDIFINGIFYDGKAPAFFSLEDMASPKFRMQVIGDITCDIMPGASVPCTIRPTKINDPVFGFDPKTGAEVPAFSKNGVDIMAIDNLPSELPRDASVFFGKQLIENVLPELLRGRASGAVVRGMICEKGALTEPFRYLTDYVEGKN